jgi:hypothetical protein
VDFDVLKAASWLTITPQQFEILHCIYRLREDGSTSSPKEIQKEYKRFSGKYLMKPNLFNILRILKGKNYIKSEGYGGYIIHFEGLREGLNSRGITLEKELTTFKSASSRIEEYFRKSSRIFEKPIVLFLEPNEWSKNITSSLRIATKYYSTTSFPNIALNQEVAAAISRPDYINILWERGVVKRDLTVQYLTDFNIEYLFNLVSKAYSNPKMAYKICLDSINQIQTHMDTHKNIQIYYQTSPLLFDLHMPENVIPLEFYSHIKGIHSENLGVVYLKSRDAAEATKQLFLDMITHGQLISGKKGNHILNLVRRRLKEQYGGVF